MLQLWLKCKSNAPVLLRSRYQRRYNNALIGYVFTPFSLIWSHFDVTPKWQDELCARSLFTFAIPDSAEVAWVWRHLHTRSNTQNTGHGQAQFQTSVLQLTVRASFIHYPVFSLGWQFLCWLTTSPTLTEPEGILRDTRSPHRGDFKDYWILGCDGLYSVPDYTASHPKESTIHSRVHRNPLLGPILYQIRKSSLCPHIL